MSIEEKNYTSSGSINLADVDVIAAAVTPCKRPGEVEPVAMQRLAQRLSSHGCNGLFVLGSTGEMVLVDDDARRVVVEAARRGTPRSTSLMIGIGGYAAKRSIELAKCAHEDGADVAIATVPFFQKLSQPEILAYFTEIADESPLPIGIYHHLRLPSSISVESMFELAQHENIVLCKDTSNDLDRMRLLCEGLQGQLFRILQGIESLVLESMQLGASGCVSALAGIAPQWHRDLVDSFKSGDLATANQYHQQILGLSQLFQLPQRMESLAHQIHLLKHASKVIELLPDDSGLSRGFQPTEEYNQAIREIIEANSLPHILDRPCKANLL
ncbi:putative 2-keto-3-deoxy-galactonate aldolase YagE [Rosistilla ulvae]|uniref:Putative 2-keto-3-deoxy-galactonate aldolase YagE n=1 Tax=Rosistilla ulvae TaxID=1930277 RepID=A0A517M2I4_9BACT|nr:dihydrodipicolinate synthase family protein [Rosistilla ulvae]QDS89090.1 putative 2-keto-3-deoxy-galactonate aldolase YagE [Rosistilla ulvae]